MGPFPSAAPGPASIFAGRSPRGGGQEPPDRRSRPPGPASPRSNSPLGRRRPRAGCARLSRPAFPSAGRRGHSTSGVGAAWAWSSLSAAAPAPADPELRSRARPPRPAGLLAPAGSEARSPGSARKATAATPALFPARGPPRHPPAVSSPQPSRHALEAGPVPGPPLRQAATSRLSAGPPRPPLGLGPSGTLPHAAGPPARWADCTPGPRLLGAPGLRRPPQRSSLARLPARPEPLQPPRAAFLPSVPSPSFAAAGAELGKPAPAAGERRELKQETRSQGGNPGGVERGEGSCWDLSGSTRASSPPALSPLGPTPGSRIPPLHSPVLPSTVPLELTTLSLAYPGSDHVLGSQGNRVAFSGHVPVC